jgi:hypothetical protein
MMHRGVASRTKRNQVLLRVVARPGAQLFVADSNRSDLKRTSSSSRGGIRSTEAPTVQNDEAFLSQHPSIKVLIEGHPDDRGSEEYNIALGTNRTESGKKAPVQAGISADRIRTVSYRKRSPFCTQNNEQCWQQNRVDDFAIER